jgi:hypothetical protein
MSKPENNELQDYSFDPYRAFLDDNGAYDSSDPKDSLSAHQQKHRKTNEALGYDFGGPYANYPSFDEHLSQVPESSATLTLGSPSNDKGPSYPKLGDPSLDVFERDLLRVAEQARGVRSLVPEEQNGERYTDPMLPSNQNFDQEVHTLPPPQQHFGQGIGNLQTQQPSSD